MGKGYWFVRMASHDPKDFSDRLNAISGPVAAFGGCFLAKDGAVLQMEGDGERPHIALLEFPSYSDAVACYRSKEYADAVRDHDTNSELVVRIEEGEAAGYRFQRV